MKYLSVTSACVLWAQGKCHMSHIDLLSTYYCLHWWHISMCDLWMPSQAWQWNCVFWDNSFAEVDFHAHHHLWLKMGCGSRPKESHHFMSPWQNTQKNCFRQVPGCRPPRRRRHPSVLSSDKHPATGVENSLCQCNSTSSRWVLRFKGAGVKITNVSMHNKPQRCCFFFFLFFSDRMLILKVVQSVCLSQVSESCPSKKNFSHKGKV